MSSKQKVLVIEDELSIRSYISTVLSVGGYDVLTAGSGKEAYSMISSHCPDAVILDLGLPDVDGMDIISEVRKWTNLPIIVVSARTHEGDKVRALDAGADDYITKPFGTSELMARLRTAIRHLQTPWAASTDNSTIKIGDLTINYDKRRVYIGEEDCHLTQNEYKLVALLGRHAGKVLTYDFIIKELWGPLAGNDNQILRVNMANIRRKLEKNPAAPEYIFTEIGVGYRMADID